MIKIIAGRLKGKSFEVPEDGVRPTSNKVREAVFDIIRARMNIDGIRMLEFFAGTGAVGFEALSRGADHVEFIENNPQTLAALKKTALSLGLEKNCIAHAGVPLGKHFDFIFADPPYKEEEFSLDPELLSSDGYFIFEAARRDVEMPGLTLVKSYRYGKTNLHLYEK